MSDLTGLKKIKRQKKTERRFLTRHTKLNIVGQDGIKTLNIIEIIVQPNLEPKLLRTIST